MAKSTGTQGQPRIEDLFRVPGAAPGSAAPKAAKAPLRKRPDEEIIAPDAAFTAGENLPDQSVATDQMLPPRAREEAPAEDEQLAEDAGSAEDAYSSVESDAWSADGWSADWTPATGSEDNILLAQAGGGERDDRGGVLLDDESRIGIFAGIGALLLLGGGDGGGGTAGATSFAAINEDLGGTTPDTVVAPVPGTAHNFYIGSAAGLGVNEGFDRDDLPTTAAQLEQKVVYDFMFSKSTTATGTISPSGLQVDMAAGDTTNINIYVSASADATTESHLVWLGNVGISGPSASADAFIGAQAIAKSGGDAEVGISNFNISLVGSGSLYASASLQASATGTGSMAGAFIGNDLAVNVSASTAYAKVAQVRAYAYGSDAVASAGIGGNLSLDAIGAYSASASAGAIYASAVSGAAAGVLIGGNVDVYAAASTSSGNAYAFVDEIYADASTDSLAQVDILGGVSVQAIGSGRAGAYIADIWASASGATTSYSSILGSGSIAEVNIGGDVYAFASAANGEAYAYVGTISASASNSSEARVTIDGDVTVRAIAENGASAYVAGIFADADGAQTYSGESIPGGGSTAEVLITGGVSAFAYAATGAAYAYVHSMSASASTSSVARVDIDGGVSARALGEDFAIAGIGDLSADADGAQTYSGESIPGGGATAEVLIGGDMSAYAVATSGTAYAYFGSISASASSSSVARIEIDGDLTARAFAWGAGHRAWAYIDGISAEAGGAQTAYGASMPGGGSTAEVLIHGNVYASAYAASGEAYAFVNSIEASASTSSVARVDIDGGVSARAIAGTGTAYAYVGNISASADGAQTYSGAAIVGGGSTAEVLIGGSVNAYALAKDGDAYAYVGQISASASTSSVARVDIGGDVTARAIGKGGEAWAYVDSISASANGAQTYSGEAIVGGGSTAEVLIRGAGGVSVYAAAASDYAYAFVGSISADASTSSLARVDITGGVTVRAFGNGSAEAWAYQDGISASAGGGDTSSGAFMPGTGSRAEVLIGGDVNVYARAENEEAHAFIESISVSATGTSYAHIDIGGDVYVTAIGGEFASAYLSEIGASASTTSTAEISIAGNLRLNAYASASGATASAFIDTIYANASTDSLARIEIGGNLSVSATAASGQAYAYVNHMYASAFDGGTASISIGEDLRVQAQGYEQAVAAIGYVSTYSGTAFGITASAEDGGQASVSIGGNVSVSATAGYGVSPEATAFIGALRAYAYGSSASAQASVYVAGDVEVSAWAFNGDAQAYVKQIAAAASYGFSSESMAVADVTIGGRLGVEARALDGSATAFVGAIEATASEDAQAHVTIGPAAPTASFDAVQVSAMGSDWAQAYIGSIGAFADSGGTADVAINGGVNVYAAATDGDAYAYVEVIHAHARDGADASVYIGGMVSVSAVATSDAYAGVESIHARAYNGGDASVTMDGLAVRAEGDDTAVAYVGSISASAGYAAGANVSIGGVTVSAAAVSTYGDAVANTAAAYVSRISAYAYNFNAYASASIDAISVSARGESGAHAHVGGSSVTYSSATNIYDGLIASAADSGTARVDIQNGVDVYAAASDGSATAFIGEIAASAEDPGSVARVEIGADVTVVADARESSVSYQSTTATVTASNSAQAMVGAVSAYAYGDLAQATVSLGDLRVDAEADASAQARVDASYSADADADADADTSARAYVGAVLAQAEGDSADASVSVGNVYVHADASASAYAYASGYNAVATAQATADAQAFVGTIAAYAADSDAQARVSVGDVSVSAQASASAYAGADGSYSATGEVGATSRAQAYVGLIGASADGDNAYAITLVGNVEVHARADATYGLTVNASYTNAYLTALSASANAVVGVIGAYAHDINAYAGVRINGDVTVDAIGEDFADAHVGTIVASAFSGNVTTGDAEANVTITGGVDVYALAFRGTAYAYVSGISATADNNGIARVTIGPSAATPSFDAVSVHADGDELAIAYVPIHAYAESESSTAEIVINGNVRVEADSDGDYAYGMLFIGAGVTTSGATGGGRVEINGDVSLSSSADLTAYAFGQVIAMGTGSVYVAGTIDIAVNTGGYAWLDIFGAGSNAVDIGNLDVNLGASASADVYIQQSVSTTPIDEFLTHGGSNANVGIGDLSVNVAVNAAADFFIGGGNSTGTGADGIAWDQLRTADLNGAGDVYMQLFDQVFGTIDATDLTGAGNHLSLEYDLGDHDFASVGTGTGDAHITTIVSFSESGTNIMFNGTNANATNFITLAGPTPSGFMSFATMTAAINAALDGGDKYVFAVYRGVEDINNNGPLDDTNAGILAYDKDGNGITAVLMLPGVTTMLPTDISFPP